MKIPVDAQSALVAIDIQRDFCAGGSLEVPQANEVIPPINRYIEFFRRAGARIYITRDWHPPDHVSFKAQGGPWPPHCVQNTKGADFHPDLRLPAAYEIISKADNPQREAYSDFDGTDFSIRLRWHRIRSLFIGGLATDYCVKATVLDGLEQGFHVFVLADACRGVEVKAGDSERALDLMKSRGAKVTIYHDLAVLSPAETE
jgi:nicotinamidase-related amidase